MKEIDLLIYDLDGTLIDSVDDIVNAVNWMLGELKLPKRSKEEIRTFVGSGVQSLVERSLGPENFNYREKALKVLKKRYTEHLLDHTKLYPGVLETLQHFKSKKQAVVTNKPEKFSIEILKALHAMPYLSLIVGGDTLRTKKPSPEGIFHVLEQLKIKNDRSVLVGDSSIDIETARNAKIDICFVTYGLGSGSGEFKPNFVIDQFDELKDIFV